MILNAFNNACRKQRVVSKMIYFDNAATTKPKPNVVIQAVVQAMNSFGNSSRGVHDESLVASNTVFQARKKLSDFFHADGYKYVAFTKNATEALNISLRGLLSDTAHVITSVTEHNSVLRPLNVMRSKGLTMDYLQVDRTGMLDADRVSSMLKSNTEAIVINHISNVTGNRNDIERLGSLCKEKGILLIVDASQSAGVVAIDMKKSNIDVLCFTGHKSLLGPQGTGGIILRKGLNVEPLLVGGSGTDSYNEYHPSFMPERLEAGTLNSHGIAGLNAALDYIGQNGQEHLSELALKLSLDFYHEVKRISGIKTYGDYSQEGRAAIVSLNIEDMDSSIVSATLSEEYYISTRAGAHCAPLIHKAMGTAKQGMVRFSFSHLNTYEEMEAAVRALHDIAKNRRMEK